MVLPECCARTSHTAHMNKNQNIQLKNMFRNSINVGIIQFPICVFRCGGRCTLGSACKYVPIFLRLLCRYRVGLLYNVRAQATCRKTWNKCELKIIIILLSTVQQQQQQQRVQCAEESYEYKFEIYGIWARAVCDCTLKNGSAHTKNIWILNEIIKHWKMSK